MCHSVWCCQCAVTAVWHVRGVHGVCTVVCRSNVMLQLCHVHAVISCMCMCWQRAVRNLAGQWLVCLLCVTNVYVRAMSPLTQTDRHLTDMKVTTPHDVARAPASHITRRQVGCVSVCDTRVRQHVLFPTRHTASQAATHHKHTHAACAPPAPYT